MAESSSERNVRRYWDEVWTKGSVAAARDVYAPRFRLNGEETSVEEFSENAEAWLGHFTDIDAEVQRYQRLPIPLAAGD